MPATARSHDLPLAPPVARVNNSLGLNRCRLGWWDSLDPGALAAESGADLVTLNGPRHFLMDRVKVSDPGPISTFAGKQLREVATIDLTKVGLAAPPAYTQVKIQRGTKFVFLAGKRIFELTDPNGRRYVMQSYAQIVDPGLRYRKLRGIGDRIGLPEGWPTGRASCAATSSSAPTARRRSSRTSSATPISGSTGSGPPPDGGE